MDFVWCMVYDVWCAIDYDVGYYDYDDVYWIIMANGLWMMDGGCLEVDDWFCMMDDWRGSAGAGFCLVGSENVDLIETAEGLGTSKILVRIR